MDSPFEVLGLDADADDDEIQAAYRARLLDVHPDQGGSVEAFKTVRTAYETLIAGSDPANTDGSEEAQAQAQARPQRPVSTTVRYLNYDVLGDYGWSLGDEDLFEQAAAADFDAVDYGRFEARPGESLLEAAENRGLAWPFACRGGACANCAIIVQDGELSMPVSHVLPAEMMERGIRLSCNGIPLTAELNVIYNVKHKPELEELLLPPRPFKQAYSDD
jgi:ferredoxin